MKKLIFLIALVTLISNIAMSQTTDQVTSEYTSQEKILDASIICWDAAIAPTKYNAFAKEFLSAPGFPKKEYGITDDEYKNIIMKYMAKLPISAIEKILAERKKAHDKLYGPRLY